MTSGPSPDFPPSRNDGRSRTWKIVVGLVLAAACIAALYAFLYRWDPRFSDDRILGLSPEQVVSQFGRPYYDSRRPIGSTVPASLPADGLMVLAYTGPLGRIYRITFHERRAVAVDRFYR
jgi:hypothetical protein